MKPYLRPTLLRGLDSTSLRHTFGSPALRIGRCAGRPCSGSRMADGQDNQLAVRRGREVEAYGSGGA